MGWGGGLSVGRWVGGSVSRRVGGSVSQSVYPSLPVCRYLELTVIVNGFVTLLTTTSQNI